MTLAEIHSKLSTLHMLLAHIHRYREAPTTANLEAVLEFASKKLGRASQDIDLLERSAQELINELHGQLNEAEVRFVKKSNAAEVCLPPRARPATVGLKQPLNQAVHKSLSRGGR